MRKTHRIIAPALLIGVAAALIGTSVAAQRGRDDGPGGDAPAALKVTASKRITQHQRDNAAARIELATAIVDRLQAEASARGLSSDWRRATLETLLPLSRTALERVSYEALNLDSLAVASAEAAEDPNLIGDPNADLTYTPIVPCRFIDTRNVGGKINGTVGYDTSTNGATYGGVAGCNPITVFGVADDEQIGALAMNVTIVDPSAAPGFVAAKPTAAAPLTSLLNWYEVGPTVQAANLGIISTSQVAGTGVNFVIQSSAAVHVIVDFFGAFIEPQATPLQNSFVAGTNAAIGAGASVNLPVATCPAGYTVTGGGPDVDSFDIVTIESRQSGNGWVCAVRSIGGASTGNCTATCARVPGR